MHFSGKLVTSHSGKAHLNKGKSRVRLMRLNKKVLMSRMTASVCFRNAGICFADDPERHALQEHEQAVVDRKVVLAHGCSKYGFGPAPSVFCAASNNVQYRMYLNISTAQPHDSAADKAAQRLR
jgi:hypothetical protein